MSYDLTVLTQQRPTEDEVRTFLRQCPSASIRGSLAEDHNLAVEAESEGWVFTVDPPVPFDWEESGLDPEDETIRHRLDPMPHWLTFVAVPYFREATGLEVGLRLAQHLATEYEGWVWDPQTEELTSAPLQPADTKPYDITLPGIDGTRTN